MCGGRMTNGIEYRVYCLSFRKIIKKIQKNAQFSLFTLLTENRKAKNIKKI